MSVLSVKETVRMVEKVHLAVSLLLPAPQPSEGILALLGPSIGPGPRRDHPVLLAP